MYTKPKNAKSMLTAGGLLGVFILFARITRLPLGTLMTLLPFLLEQWRKYEAQKPTADKTQMTREEACLILGVSAGDNKGTILEAHRRLIQKNHPDLGGTDYLAAKINQARDILLK